MNITKQIKYFLAFASVSLMFSMQVAEAAVAGKVQFVHGNVKVTTSGVTRTLRKGDRVSEGDFISTAISSSAQIKMLDGGFVAIRPNTQMKFDQFVFSGKQDGNERSIFSLLKGGFRAVTGLIGSKNKRNYRIKTPSATIGIRGTDHESFVVPPLGAIGSPAGEAQPGTYSKVNVGETTLTTNLGTVNVLPNQMGFASGLNARPVLAPVNTSIFTVAAAPSKTIKENEEENAGKTGQGASGQKDGEKTPQDGNAKQPGNDGAQARKNGEGDNGQAAAGAPAPAPEADGSGPAPIRTVAGDVAPALNSPPQVGAPQPVPVIDAPQLLVPVVLVNSTTGATLNSTTQTLVQDGSTTTLNTLETKPVSNPYVVTSLLVADSLTFSAFGQPYNFETLPTAIDPSAADPSFTVTFGGTCSVAPCSTGETYTLTGATGAVPGAANSVTSTGIKFGRYAAVPALTTTTLYAGSPPTSFTQTFSGGYGSWIAGPSVNPFYLPEALVGTATYVFDGGTAPVTQAGSTGAIGSASLTVNFTNQSVGANLAVNGGGHSWTATATAMPLTSNSGVGNSRSHFDTYGGGTLNIVMDGTTTGQGYISGQITGNGINGAFLQYYFNDTLAQSISGAAAFRIDTFNGSPATTVNLATPYQLVAISRYDPLGVSNGGNTFYDINGTFNNAGRVIKDAAGNLTRFDMGSNNGGSTQGGTAVSQNSNIISIGTATTTNLGKDTVSGISWGRWQGGNMGVSDRVTNTPLASVSNTTSSLHWLAAPIMNGPVTLPASGTFTYSLGGGTNPTDNLGNVGTLNGATLQADFSAMTVNVGVNATVAGTNYVATGSNLPIQQTIFGDGNGGGTFTATANGVATQGGVGGSFTGIGATGAGVVYGFQDRSTTVNGVLAFHR
ncbi:MAG: FecR family protein [Gammaproteobacteria bacterium]|nr:FecR family protein [Gammaproteobacteria bacterium]MBU1624424.1 FecR family protein [Gammaproteobacteria bacterium]MBU1981152.1 FecR family protein [Gammaproteobacteria bacterium]